MLTLSTPLSRRLLQTTDEFIEALKEYEVRTVEDLLLYLPRAYEDLSTLTTLDQVEEGQKVTLRGTISELKQIRTRHKKMILTQASFTDTNGNVCQVVWFNQPHIKRMIGNGADLVLAGKIGMKGNKLVLQSPTFEEGDRELRHAGRIVPIYPQHSILSTRWLREKIPLVQEAIHEFAETLPQEVIEEENLLPRADMVRQLHFPESGVMLERARERQSFEQLFELQTIALNRKQEWQGETQERLRIPMNVELIRSFFDTLKFTPTDSQKVAIYEILQDIEKPVPMSRLLEGDVGSGKTLVATAVMANVIHAGGQCALMVPTEVLAKQHAEGVSKMLLGFREYLLKETGESAFEQTSVALLTGSTPAPDARTIKQGLLNGTIDIVVGTHSLIQSDVQFKDLKLAIVDEQHRFGVNQRKALQDKGSPHFLSMTATPIPRTLALTAFGDHDLSVLLEKPGNRKEIKTKVVPPQERKTIEYFIDNQINEGRQAYVICPLIKESDELADVRNVLNEAERLREAFPNRRIAALHGKLKAVEKDNIMQAFKNKETDILVSTSVIEVGIDVPNSTIILIEGSERFGLAQLHQLRGRVGRGEHQSYCFLATSQREQASSDRLKAMEQFSDGFQLAEIDLKLRGPGEIYGTIQSGFPEIRVGSLTNPELVARARKAAEKALKYSYT